MNKILLVITTYNESEYTKLCFDSLKLLKENFDVLVVDDCSTDKTNDILTDLAKKNTYIKIVNNKENMGFANAFF